MANFFDKLAQRYATQPFAPAPQQQTMNVGAMASPFTNMPSVAASQPLQTPQASQPRQATADANPFDQFDDHAVDSPDTIPTATPDMGAPDASYDVSEQQRAASQSFNQDISDLVNSGATRAQIEARIAQEAAAGNSASVNGLDEGLAWRDAHRGATVPVGIANTDALSQKTEYHGLDQGRLDAAASGALDSISLGSADEVGGFLSATANSIGNVVGTGTGEDFGDAYTRLRDENRQRLDDSQNYHPGYYLGGQIAGGLATAPIGGGEFSLARAVGEGAAYGGVYGFNSGKDGIVDRAESGLEGAAFGGAGGAVLGGIGAGAGRLLRGNGEARAAARETFDAAERLNNGVAAADRIVPMPAHVGGPVVRGSTSALKHTLVGGGIVEPGMRDFVSATQGARNRIADDIIPGASSADREAVTARMNDPNDANGLASYEARWKAENDKIYSRAEWLANGATIETPSTVRAIDNRIAELSGAPGNPHEASIATLGALRDDLANNRYTVDKLRLSRSDWGKTVDSNDGVLRGMSKTLYGTLSQDIDSGLRSQGHVGAAQHYARADAAYREGLDFIKNDLPTIFGRNGDADADRVLSNVEGLIRQGKSSTLTRVLDEAPANLSAHVRGGIVSALGRTAVDPVSGQVGFSAPVFIRQWDKMTGTAKSALFDQRTITALNDVRTLATAAVRSGVSDNGSKTSATAFNKTMMDTVFGLAVNATHVGTLGHSLLAQLGSEATFGFLLSRPGVARALAGVTRNKPGAMGVLQRRVGEAVKRAPKALLQMPAATMSGLHDQNDGSIPNGAITIGGAPQQEAPPTGEANPFDQFD
jgi:hypothetical protein